MSDVVIGVDCSTTACKALAWDRNGRPLAEGRSSLEEIRPRPLYSEQVAEGWWDATSAFNLIAQPWPVMRRSSRTSTGHCFPRSSPNFGGWPNFAESSSALLSRRDRDAGHRP